MFPTKEEINTKAQAYKDRIREDAIKELKTNIEAALDQANINADKEGESFTQVRVRVPEVFKNPNGEYYLPTEIKDSLVEAGYIIFVYKSGEAVIL